MDSPPTPRAEPLRQRDHSSNRSGCEQYENSEPEKVVHRANEPKNWVFVL